MRACPREASGSKSSKATSVSDRQTPHSNTTLGRATLSSAAHGGRRYSPYAFTEHGVAMLAAVLNSPRAIQVSIEIVRAFVRLRAMLAGNAELARKLTAPEKK